MNIRVPKHVRVQRAFGDPRPMAGRSEAELRQLAGDVGINPKTMDTAGLARELENKRTEELGVDRARLAPRAKREEVEQ